MNHLIHACEEMKKKNFTEFQDTKSIYQTHWLISQQYKLIACKNHKVGSTNIARVLYTLDHLSQQNDSNRIATDRARQIVDIGNGEKKRGNFDHFLKSSKKFVFVRDPVARLLSAYRSHRPSTLFANKSNIEISFKDYLKWSLAIPDKKANPHVVSFTRMCNPCRVNYDFIGLMDNYGADMMKILRSVGADEYVILPQQNRTGYGKNHTDQILKSYLKDIPKTIIQKVYEKYYWDYFLFGFPKPDF